MAKKTAGQMLVAIREERGWEREEMAVKCGFTDTYLRQFENDAVRLTDSALVKISRVTGIPFEELERRLGLVKARKAS